MAARTYKGKYVEAFLSDKKIKSESIESDYYNNLIEVKENEAVNIYSYKGNKLVFAKGFDKIINKKDDEINMRVLLGLYTPYTKSFIDEFHDRLLLFVYNNNKNNSSFSSHAIVNFNNYDNPFMISHKMFKTDKNGNLLSMIGTTTKDDSLKISNVIQYEFSGDFDPDFLDLINNDLEFVSCISYYNIKIIESLEKGNDVSSVSKELDIKEENIERNINKLLKRFDLKDNQELIEFAKKNYLIPNQFDKYLNK